MDNNISNSFANYEFIPDLFEQIEKVIIGKRDVIKMLIAALLSGDKKPFDCRVWPFRVNRIADSILGITVSPVCETVSALPLSKLSAFLNEKHDESGSLADIMLDYAKKHPYIIKPYIDDYPVLKIIKG